MAWNVKPSEESLSDFIDDNATQELLLSAYMEEQAAWNKKMVDIETRLKEINESLKALNATSIKWWEVLAFKWFKRIPRKQKRMAELEAEVKVLNDRYLNLIENMPKIDRYEFAMYGTKMFKIKVW